MTGKPDEVTARLDAVVDDFARRTRFFTEPLTEGRAKMFVRQHRLNSRQRNSVLKLKVATNTPDWNLKLDIIGACTACYDEARHNDQETEFSKQCVHSLSDCADPFQCPTGRNPNRSVHDNRFAPTIGGGLTISP